MNQDLAILLIGGDAASSQALKTSLAQIPQVNVVDESADVSKALLLMKKNNPDVVVLTLFPDEEPALKCAERITQNHPDCFLFVTAPQAKPELIINAMRAGAREFWVQPFRIDELQHGIHNAIRIKKQTSQQVKRGKVISVFGVKGGVGTTTVASNLAVVTMERSKREVLLLDWTFQLGQAALFLNIQPQYSMVDIVHHIQDIQIQRIENIDPVLVKSVLPKADCGAYFLGGPGRMEDAEDIKAVHVQPVLNMLRVMFDYIIVDTPPQFDELTLKLLDEADVIIPLFTFDVPAVYNAKRCLELFHRLGYGSDKLFLIMNRHQAHDSLDVHTVERTIGQSIFWRIPNQDYASLIRSINEGIPLSQSVPKSRLTLSLNEMLEQFNGTLNVVDPIMDDKNRPGLLKKIFTTRG
jgi:pilus assembly protein CpaE